MRAPDGEDELRQLGGLEVGDAQVDPLAGAVALIVSGIGPAEQLREPSQESVTVTVTHAEGEEPAALRATPSFQATSGARRAPIVRTVAIMPAEIAPAFVFLASPACASYAARAGCTTARGSSSDRS